MNDEVSIIVLAGGLSDEREVSINSGKAIYDSLKKSNIPVRLIDPANGQSLLDNTGNLLQKIGKKQIVNSGKYALKKTLRFDDENVESVVFLALHGGAGEDGTIQALLDLAGIKYTGSGKAASALAMNKAITKKLASGENIPTPDWRLIKKYDINKIDQYKQQLTARLFPPVIVKPNDSGSTVGLTLVKSEQQLDEALATAAEISEQILIEQYIKGREITAAVLDGQPLPLVEIIPSGELYDYRSKYSEGGSQYICPAEIDQATTDKIHQFALTIYTEVGCEGLARIDFILADETPYFLEVNTLPGMTSLSLAPMAARAAGIEFDDLIKKLIKSALAK